MDNPYVVLILAALSFALGQSGALLLHVTHVAGRLRVLRFAWGLLLYASLCLGERAIWALFAWLLGTAATDFVASYGDLFTLIGLGSVPLLLAVVSFAPHLGPFVMGILYVVSFFDVVGRARDALGIHYLPAALWLGISWLAALLAVWAAKRLARDLSARSRLDPLRDVRLLTSEDVLALMPGPGRTVDRETGKHT